MLKSEKKSGPKDKRHINQEQDYKVSYQKMRKQAARKFGQSKEDA